MDFALRSHDDGEKKAYLAARFPFRATFLGRHEVSCITSSSCFQSSQRIANSSIPQAAHWLADGAPRSHLTGLLDQTYLHKLDSFAFIFKATTRGDGGRDLFKAFLLWRLPHSAGAPSLTHLSYAAQNPSRSFTSDHFKVLLMKNGT